MTSKLAVALFALAPLAALAGAPDPGAPRKPPQEAYDACAGSAAADACAVKLRDRSVAGSCAADSDGSLFCLPAHPPRHEPPGPPPEALEACRERTQAASCTVTLPSGESLTGQCLAERDGEDLACRPDGQPPRNTD